MPHVETSDYVTFDGQTYIISGRQLVSYEVQMDVTRFGKTSREWVTISFTVGKVKPA